MIRFLSIVLTCLTQLSVLSGYTQQLVVKKDLVNDWKVSTDNGFVPYEQGDESTNVIYFRVRTPHPAAELLKISGLDKFTLFINNKLAGSGHTMLLNLDSLSAAYSSNELLIAIHQEDIHPKTLSTHLMSETRIARSAAAPEERASYFFRDFGILAALLLLVMVVIVIRVNPKLASDYFSPGKIFSLREDETQLAIRIGSSTNILFYVYCSLLLGYYLVIVFQYLPADYKVVLAFQPDSFWGAAVQWLKLSGLLMLIVIGKIILVLNLSFLFGLGELGGIHIFNWVRFIVVFFGLLAVALFVYFLSHGYSEEVHSFFLKLVVWLSGLWIILLFLKLSGKANASMFHLFSYICATEVIPFLLIIKVLYN